MKDPRLDILLESLPVRCKYFYNDYCSKLKSEYEEGQDKYVNCDGHIQDCEYKGDEGK